MAKKTILVTDIGNIAVHKIHRQGAIEPDDEFSSDWTYVQVNGGADFSTTSATPVDVTGLGFTPLANTTYEFEAMLMLQTATNTVNPRTGLAWPSGGVDGVAIIRESQTPASFIVSCGNIAADLLIAVGGLPNTTGSWPCFITGTFRAGSTPSGDVRVQLASETAGTFVTIKVRSFLKYRTLAF